MNGDGASLCYPLPRPPDEVAMALCGHHHANRAITRSDLQRRNIV